MELREFVRTTLTQIAEGIAEANRQLQGGDTGAVINPAESFHAVPKEIVRPVEFDVALTITDESSSKEVSSTGGKAGILSVASVNASLGSEGQGSNKREAISRVQFSVLMQQPANISQPPPIQVPTAKTGFNRI